MLRTGADSKFCMQNCLRLLGTSFIVTGIHPGPEGPSITLCSAPLQRLDTFPESSQFLRLPPVFQVVVKLARSSLPSVRLSYLLKGLGKSLPPLVRVVGNKDPAVLGFQPVRLGCIHYACPFGALMQRHLLPRMGVGLWKLLSTYRMPVFGSGSPELMIIEDGEHAPGC